MATNSWLDNTDIQVFREYLRIPSVHPDIDYTPCVEFLKQQAIKLDLPIEAYYPGSETKPVVVISWRGREPNLPSILLNSHMDVVPVYEEKWTHPPFGAEMDDEGRIFARGSQDMKCVGLQYLAAIRELRKSGVSMKRTIHVTFVPDEEIGGQMGMEKFVQTIEFKHLNVGFSLDEGVVAPHETYLLFYAERSLWQINFKISGTAGHGSRLLESTVAHKLQNLLNKLMDFREKEATRLAHDRSLTLGDITTLNMTVIKGGVQGNVVPSILEACFDIRLAVTENHEEFEQKLHEWCIEAGGDIELDFKLKEPHAPATKIDDTNPYYVEFMKAINEMGMKIRTMVLPGGSDSRFLRAAGVSSIGFTAVNETPILLHDHDEFLKAESFLKGIEIYKKIIPAVANALPSGENVNSNQSHKL